MKKRVEELWLIHDVLFTKKSSAEAVEDGKEKVKKVYVGVDEDLKKLVDGESAEFYGSWVFSTRKEAEDEVRDFNS